MALGKEIGNFPDGETTPRSNSVKAGPAIVPKCHAYKIESTSETIGSRINDLPA